MPEEYQFQQTNQVLRHAAPFFRERLGSTHLCTLLTATRPKNHSNRNDAKVVLTKL
jgi:hypothetical protein